MAKILDTPAIGRAKGITQYANSCWENPEALAQLKKYLGYWEAINLAHLGTIPLANLIGLIEECFGKKMACSTCPSVFSTSRRAFENKVFTFLWSYHSFIMPRMDLEVLGGTALGGTENYNAINCGGYHVTDEWRTRLTQQVRNKELANILVGELNQWKSARLRFFDSEEYKALKSGLEKSDTVLQVMEAPTPPAQILLPNMPMVSPDQLVAFLEQGMPLKAISEKMNVSVRALQLMRKKMGLKK